MRNLILFWGVFLFSALMIANVNAQQTITFPTNSLRACWNLNESFGQRQEESGLSPQLSLTDINTVQSGPGVNGQAAVFDADNSEYLVHPHNNRLSLGSAGGGSWTISAFVNFAGGGVIASNPSPSWLVSADSTILGKSPQLPNQTGKEYILAANEISTPQGSRWRVKMFIFDSAGNEVLFYSQSTPLRFNTWYHIIVEYDNVTQNLNIIVDNFEITNYLHNGGFQYGTQGFHIGTVSKSSLDFFTGSIDQVMIFKDKLDTNQKTFLFNNGSGQTCQAVISGGPLPPPSPPTPTPQPTPTVQPTPTPDTSTFIDLPSGNQASIAWDVTIGEVFVASLLMCIIAIMSWYVVKEIAHTAARK